MGIRAVIILLVTIAGLFGAWFKAFYGLITYVFWVYVDPEKNTWGLLPIRRLAFVVGATVVLTTIIQKRRLLVANKKTFLMLAFLSLSFIAAYYTAPADYYSGRLHFQYLWRNILIACIIPVLVEDMKTFRYFCWAVVVFIGLNAARAGFMGTIAGVTYLGRDSGYTGLYGERNFMGAYLCTVLPFIFYFARTVERRSIRLFLYAILAGDLLALILTYSRGAFIGLVIVTIFILLRSKRKILTGIALLLVAAALGYGVLSHTYKERIQTISKSGAYDAEKSQYGTHLEGLDPSAAGRIMLWRIAIEMIKDHPITGVGYYYSRVKQLEYEDPVTGYSFPKVKAIHNTPLFVTVECGIPSFVIFFILYFFAFLDLERLKKRVKRFDLDPGTVAYANMLQGAFVGFFAAAMFINASNMGLPWHMVGLVIALERIVAKEIEQGSEAR